jgi:imidazoleglycerol-phosphate dehydratase
VRWFARIKLSSFRRIVHIVTEVNILAAFHIKENQMPRKAVIERKTKETDIKISLNLDGTGAYSIKTSVPFMDHMLSHIAKHGFFDLTVTAKGDTAIDDHHTVEDMGIVFGQALKKALGESRGIRRYGESTVPMDETLAHAAVDLSGRPYLAYRVVLPKKYKLKNFDPGVAEHFFQSVVNHAGMNLHIRLLYGRDVHHMLEAIFKAFGRALDQATSLDPRITGVLSTKGRI